MKRRLWKVLLVVVALVLVAGVGLWMWRSGRPESKRVSADGSEYRYKPLKIVAGYIAMMEKPDAAKAWFADEASLAWRDCFEHAGLRCFGPDSDEGRFDIIVAAGPKTAADWRALVPRLSETGVVSWNLDMRGKTVADFKSALEAFPCPQAHVWMPGENDWLLTGRMTPRRVKLDVALEIFTREQSFDDLAEAECETLGSLFSSYVGCREDVTPAFAGDLSVPARPEFFLTQEAQVADWFVRGDVDEDIYEEIGHDIRSMQVVRRLIVEGNMLALKKDGLEAAEEKWAAAAARNPHDPMLRDRLYRLALNARVFMKVGNYKGAARCLETMIVIRPTDAAAIAEYAECLKILGKRELADEVLHRATVLLKRADDRFDEARRALAAWRTTSGTNAAPAGVAKEAVK